jgi:RNA polymerase sigma-70 factor (ECF subfamily)
MGLPVAPPRAPNDAGALLEPALARRLRRYLHVLGCRADRVDDLVQETVLVALRAGFRDQGPAAAWLFAQRTARHLYLQQVRSLQQRREVELAHEVFAAQCNNGGRDDGGDAFVAALRECVAALPERSRRLLEGTYGDDLGRTEIGRALGLSPDGVKTALRRLRAALRECIERRRGGP